MQTPFFSIIIPCYNSQEYIIETLDSIKNQSFKDFEVILVDDLSSDNSYNISVDYFNNNNLSGICIKKDLRKYPKGVSGARNQGIDLAKGEWICFLDSDDLFTENKLFELYESISQNSSILAFHHAVVEFEDKTGKVLNTVILPNVNQVHSKLPDLLKFNNICTSTVCLHISLLTKLNNFNTSLNGIEDFYCWLKVSKITNWYYSKNINTRYRVRGESLMGFRKLPHYINQNWGLLQVVKLDNQFSSSEYKVLEEYLMKNVIKYYVNNSVDKFGLFNTTLGLIPILKLGYLNTFFSNNYRIYKNYILKTLFK
ncbi:MAG: glycosyltransferase family A protein [Cytophagales bacterium]